MSLQADYDHGCGRNAPAKISGTLEGGGATRQRKRDILLAAPASGYPARVACCSRTARVRLGIVPSVVNRSRDLSYGTMVEQDDCAHLRYSLVALLRCVSARR
jgi:hypothetical protein